MEWRNQSVFVSWLPRVGSSLLVVGALLGAANVVFNSGSLLFAALVAAFVIPWSAFVAWLGWRNAPVQSVTLDVNSREVSFAFTNSVVRLPVEALSVVTLWRGLLWVKLNARDGIRLGSVFVLALYDQPLRDFVRTAGTLGIRVAHPYGGSVLEDKGAV